MLLEPKFNVSLADTVGILYPAKVSELVSALISELKIPLHMHCHNDFGLATSNALQALQSGVKCVDVTINGLGERCGLPPLAEVTAALDELFKIDHSWDLKKLKLMSSYIDKITKTDNKYYLFSYK